MTNTRVTALFSALVLAVFGGILAGCEAVAGGPGRARGEAEEITVVTDSATWAGPVGEAIRAELAAPIPTLPSSQGAFKLRFQPLDERLFDQIKRLPNLVFAAPIDTEGPIGEFLRARVGGDGIEALRAGDAAALNIRPDLWYEDQLVVIATAASDTALAREFLQNGEELRDAFNELARDRTISEMFARLRQVELEDELLAEYDFRVQIQHDYVPVQDTTVSVLGRTGDFVRYRRVLSDTWRDFFVYVEDDVETLPSEEELDRLTNALLEEFARGSEDSSYVQIDDRRPIVSDTVTLAGRPALETRGLWYLVNDVMGGSFVRYAFLDEDTDRLYVYYGMTFAPSRRLDKRKFLRQMEAIAYTFRTRADLDAEAAEAAAVES